MDLHSQPGSETQKGKRGSEGYWLATNKKKSTQDFPSTPAVHFLPMCKQFIFFRTSFCLVEQQSSSYPPLLSLHRPSAAVAQSHVSHTKTQALMCRARAQVLRNLVRHPSALDCRFTEHRHNTKNVSTERKCQRRDKLETQTRATA